MDVRSWAVSRKLQGGFRVSLLLGAALSWASMVGCAAPPAEEPPGDLSLSWRISPMGCEGSQVSRVEVSIQTPDKSYSEQIVYDCQTRRALIEDLVPRAYVVQLLGVEANGKTTFASESVRVGVGSGLTATMAEQRLTARPASLEVGWRFDDGRLCAVKGVERIAVGVYDADAFAIDEQVFDCVWGVGVIEGLRSGDYVIEAIGLSASGQGVFRGLGTVSLERGDHRSAEVVLESCEGGCQ